MHLHCDLPSSKEIEDENKKCKLKNTNREKLISKCLLSVKEDIRDNFTMESHKRILSLSKQLQVKINAYVKQMGLSARTWWSTVLR